MLIKKFDLYLDLIFFIQIFLHFKLKKINSTHLIFEMMVYELFVIIEFNL